MIADALDLGVGGFIVFGGTVEAVRRLTADLLRRAERPLLIASDLERGAGQQIAGLLIGISVAAFAGLGLLASQVADGWAVYVIMRDAAIFCLSLMGSSFGITCERQRPC